MHQHTHQHAFTPVLHQSLTILPAPMGTQDTNFNTHLLRAATRPPFAPVTAFHTARQKPFSSTKRGRWGALHVCIAWKIYYHEKLKKMQQKPNSPHQELTPEYLATSGPDVVRHKEPEQPSCIRPNINSPCGHSADGDTGGRSETGKTAEHLSHFNRSSDLYTSLSASCHSRTTKREKLEKPPNLHWKEKLDEKEKNSGQQVKTTNDLPLTDISWGRTATPELDGRHGGSLDRKRQLECDSSVKVKRVKQEIVEDQFDSSRTLHTDPHTHPSSRTMLVQHLNIPDVSILYPNSSRCNVTRTPGALISYPGTEMHPYQNASWEPMWDFHKRMDLRSRQNVLKDYSLNACKAIRIPLAAQKQKEAFHGFFRPPLCFPLALKQQDTVFLRGREFLHENCHLHHPGYLATYLGP